MTDTTWTYARIGIGRRAPARRAGIAAIMAGIWNRRLTAPLHRALDGALRAGELRDLGSHTLADIGYRRG